MTGISPAAYRAALQEYLVRHEPERGARRLAQMPGNVRVTCRQSGLKKPSIADVTQLHAVRRKSITASAGRLPALKMRELWSGSNLVFGSPFTLESG